MKQYKYSQLSYVPNDFDQIQKKLNSCVDKIKTAPSAEEVFSVIAEYDAMMEDAGFAANMAYIRSSLDCTDQFYAEAAQKEAMGFAALNASSYFQALLESPFLPDLEERFGPEYRPRLEKGFKVNAAGHELMAQEQALVNQFQQKKAMLQIDFQGKKCSEGELFVFFDNPDRRIRLESRKALAETVLVQKGGFFFPAAGIDFTALQDCRSQWL